MDRTRHLDRFIKAADPDLLRLNLMLLLFVSFLPFTTAIAATHLFASNVSFHEVTVLSSAERVAVVVFGLNLTLAAPRRRPLPAIGAGSKDTIVTACRV